MKINRRRGFIAFALVAVSCLVALGVWQVQRLHWKEQLIKQATASLTARPVSMNDITAGIEYGYDVNLMRVRLNGTYRFDLNRYIYWPQNGKPGYRVITPFLDKLGYIVLVDRGWVSQRALKAKPHTGWREPEGTVTVTGITRAHARAVSFLTAPPDKKNHIWYAYDLAGIAASLPANLGETAQDGAAIVSPLFVQLEPKGEPGKGRWPQIPPAKIDLPNNHLQYAITWFSLAAIVALMSILYLRRK